jgi:DNA-binding NarL/FixJ family response regulator
LISGCVVVYDLLIIEIDLLHDIKSTSISNLINTISALLDCNLTSHTPKLAIACNKFTDSKIIKELLNTNIVGIYPQGTEFTFEEKSIALIEMLNNKFHIPYTMKLSIESPSKCTNCKHSMIKLTPRESQILTLIQDRGVSNKIIAKMLHITESTVKLHITHIFKKYGVKNRTQLALFSKGNTEV